MRVSGKHNDLDNVGPSLRHHTFFEMLGNFSFGDYFKHEAIPFAWELLTDGVEAADGPAVPDHLQGRGGIPRDDEAHEHLDGSSCPADRIGELGADDNFWAMGDTGPCGRCSEIHYFRGNDIPCDEERRRPPRRSSAAAIATSRSGTTCSWSSTAAATARSSPLPAPSIDTGMGLERITAVIQGKLSNYDTDLFTPILDAIGERAGPAQRRARRWTTDDVSMRVVADHLRAMTFLIADGVVPSNEWRGYVLRKIMRRAMRHGKKLGFTEPFLHTLVDVLVARDGRRLSRARRRPRQHRPRWCAARRSGSTRC